MSRKQSLHKPQIAVFISINKERKLYMSRRLELLLDGETKKAEEVRKRSIPARVYKFVPLFEEDVENQEIQKHAKYENDKRFTTLENEMLWFSAADKLNDPFEYQCVYLDEDNLTKQYPQNYVEAIRAEQVLYKRIALVSLSAASYNSLPMWAYYTNNYHGFCIEYKVVSKKRLCKVDYECERIPESEIQRRMFTTLEEMIQNGQDISVDFREQVTVQKLFLKHKSWKHEKEFRAVEYMKSAKNGINVSIKSIGLTTNHLIVGNRCEPQHIERLKEISSKLNCGDVEQISPSPTSYLLLEDI